MALRGLEGRLDTGDGPSWRGGRREGSARRVGVPRAGLPPAGPRLPPAWQRLLATTSCRQEKAGDIHHEEKGMYPTVEETIHGDGARGEAGAGEAPAAGVAEVVVGDSVDPVRWRAAGSHGGPAASSFSSSSSFSSAASSSVSSATSSSAAAAAAPAAAGCRLQYSSAVGSPGKTLTVGEDFPPPSGVTMPVEDSQDPPSVVPGPPAQGPAGPTPHLPGRSRRPAPGGGSAATGPYPRPLSRVGPIGPPGDSRPPCSSCVQGTGSPPQPPSERQPSRQSPSSSRHCEQQPLLSYSCILGQCAALVASSWQRRSSPWQQRQLAGHVRVKSTTPIPSLMFVCRSWILPLVFLTLMCTFGITPSSAKQLRDVQALPRRQDRLPSNKSSGAVLQMDSTTYLMKFGYLPMSDMETGALRTQEEMERAVRKLQRMAHLPVTGRLDQATIEKIGQPRCGVADDLRYQVGWEEDHSNARRHGDGDGGGLGRGRSRGRRYVIGPSKWQKSDLTYRILNYSPDLPVAVTHDVFRRAFYVWHEVTNLNFYEIHQGHADMYIRFARGYHHDGFPFDGPGMTLAHAFFPGEDIGGDVHFDEDERWTSDSPEGVDLFMVAAHEIGHALGLGHSSVEGSLMYPWYQGHTRNFQLHSDDIAGIQSLYGYKYVTLRPQPEPAPTPRSTSVPERPVSPSRPAPPETPGNPRPPVVTPTPRATSTLAPGPWSPDRPGDPCTVSIDSVATIRGEAFFFKGMWFWRINENGVMDGYPVEVNRFWYLLPEDVDHFDAVYERHDDGKIVFFFGKRYWLYNGNHMAGGFPVEGKPITDFGLPADIERVDAAFVWGHNLKTYLVTGNMYWRYSETNGHMDYDYPRDMSMWAGVPLPLDAAFTDGFNGKTYFFQDQYYWEFNNARMEVQRGYPKKLGYHWLDCNHARRNDVDIDEYDDGTTDTQVSAASATQFSSLIGCLTLSILTTCLSLGRVKIT